MVHWTLSDRADPRALPLADRHYNRQKIGTPQFVPPGRCIVLLTLNTDALWVSSWPFAEFTKHEWAGAWICSCFRNEAAILSSTLILEAVACTRSIWGSPPPYGMITFVNAAKVRHKRDPGRCFLKAGFEHVGMTKTNKLLAFQLKPERMPEPLAPMGRMRQLTLGTAFLLTGGGVHEPNRSQEAYVGIKTKKDTAKPLE